MADNDIAVILKCAALAPSVHNTQPWRLDARGDDIDVVAERDRQLAFLDPSGRQMHVSCGAAIEFAYLAARVVGRDCDVALLPDRMRPELLATLRTRPGAAPSAEETALADAIAIRYTDRGPYSDRPVPPEIVSDAQRRAGELDVWVHQVVRPEDRQVVIAVLAAAEAAEAADARYTEELAQWTSRDDDAGIPADAAAPHWPADRVTDVPLRDFSGGNRHPLPGDRPDEAPPTVERDLLLMVGTEADDPGSWLASGRALGWTLLRAASAGVSAQPLGQAIDLPAGRDRLRHELGLVGHPQFLLRLGYGHERPRTRRVAARG